MWQGIGWNSGTCAIFTSNHCNSFEDRMTCRSHLLDELKWFALMIGYQLSSPCNGHQEKLFDAWIHLRQFFFSDDGAVWLASCAQDCFIRLWKISSREESATQKGTSTALSADEDIKLKDITFNVKQKGKTCLINSLAPGKFEWHFRYLIFQILSMTNGWCISYEIALRWMSLDLTDDKVNIGSGYGLVPSGNKPLPEPMLTQISNSYITGLVQDCDILSVLAMEMPQN